MNNEILEGYWENLMKDMKSWLQLSEPKVEYPDED